MPPAVTAEQLPAIVLGRAAIVVTGVARAAGAAADLVATVFVETSVAVAVRWTMSGSLGLLVMFKCR